MPMTPASCNIQNLPDELKYLVRGLFRQMVKDGMVEHDLGLEACYEVLEGLYNLGRIKMVFEGSVDKRTQWRVMVYEEPRGGYLVAEKIVLIKDPHSVNPGDIIVSGFYVL